jgi:hypothetical protein
MVSFRLWPLGRTAGLDDMGTRKFLTLPGLQVIRTGSGVHSASYPMGTVGSFPGVKRQGREAYLSPPASAEVKTV